MKLDLTNMLPIRRGPRVSYLRCIETQEVYNSIRDAYVNLDPPSCYTTWRRMILNSIKQGKSLYGYTWELI